MALNTTINIDEILNRVAAEVGIAPVQAPLASQDPFYVQLGYLLQTAGEELMQAYPWELLVRTHTINMTAGDPNTEYDMPDDFGYILNDTEWDNTNNVPMGGPLSAQDWTYLKGRDLASNTLYASFRIAQGKFNVYPETPANDTTLSFEYISSHWVYDPSTNPVSYKGSVTLASDIPLFDKTLITRALKVKYLEAGGFDTQKAQADYNQIFAFLTGTEKGARVLNAGGRRGGLRLLNGYNSPDTGFGGGRPA
jgi:hypothetical protein